MERMDLRTDGLTHGWTDTILSDDQTYGLVGESFELGEQNILSTISTGQSKCVVALATTM